jgi:hypothetical protein
MRHTRQKYLIQNLNFGPMLMAVCIAISYLPISRTILNTIHFVSIGQSWWFVGSLPNQLEGGSEQGGPGVAYTGNLHCCGRQAEPTQGSLSSYPSPIHRACISPADVFMLILI